MDRPTLSTLRKPTTIEQELERIQSRNTPNLDNKTTQNISMDSASLATIDSTTRRSINVPASNSTTFTSASNSAITTHKAFDSMDYLPHTKSLNLVNDSSKLLSVKRKDVELFSNDNKKSKEVIETKNSISSAAPSKANTLFSTPVSIFLINFIKFFLVKNIFD